MRRRTIFAALAAVAIGCGREVPPGAPGPGARKAPPEVPPALAVSHRHPRLYERDGSDPLPALLEKMEATSGEVLHWAQARLAERGEEAVPPIRRKFTLAYGRAENAPLLANLCEVLGRIRLPSCVPPLREALTHPNGLVREKAFDGLAAIGAAEAVADLAVVFEQDPIPLHRSQCLRAIAAARTEEAAGVIRAILVNEAFLRQHREALDLLAAFPEPLARPALGEALLRLDPGIAVAAARALARFGDRGAIGRLEQAAKAAAPNERVEAAAGLGAARRLDLLSTLARDPAWAVRASVAAAVGIATGTEPEPPAVRPPWKAPPAPPWPEGKVRALEILRSLLEDEERPVRDEAVRRCCALGDRSPLRQYVEALASSSERAWREALEILIDPQVAGVEAVAAILARLEKTAGADRRPLLQALGHLRDPRAEAVLVRDMREGSGVRIEEETLADYAALMLANVGDAAIPPLRAAVAPGEAPSLRRAALRALTFMGAPAAGDLLLEVATRAGEDAVLRATAARAAPRVCGPRAAGPLKRALYAETDPRLRELLNCVLHDYF